mmetsp:Transcript_7773/g.10984  ORF Transcript_7773/g.10984 Transcript_7773/m.10984 type:complete len:137 (+) Transcript_7773:641-1051(+)
MTKNQQSSTMHSVLSDIENSNLFVVQEEIELETGNSTAEKKSNATKVTSGLKSKENQITALKMPAKARTPGAKLPSASSGIGKGLTKNLSKQDLAKKQVKDQSKLDESSVSIRMDRSVFYKSYFADVSSISQIDES